jgi:hypothetical protein
MRTKEAPAVQQIRRDATYFPAVLTIDWIRVPARHRDCRDPFLPLPFAPEGRRADNPLVLNA